MSSAPRHREETEQQQDRNSELMRQDESAEHESKRDAVNVSDVDPIRNRQSMTMSPNVSSLQPTPPSSSPTPMVRLKRHYSGEYSQEYTNPSTTSASSKDSTPSAGTSSAFSPYWHPHYYHPNQGGSAFSRPLTISSTTTPTTDSFPTTFSARVSEPMQMHRLKWNDYEFEVVDRLEMLYKSTEFTDVTLSCEGQVIKAHKVILAMCSSFFRKMFQETPCKHPLVIVNGMKPHDLQRVIQFIYIGHVSVNKNEIDDFIDAAASLRIDGVNSSPARSSSPLQLHTDHHPHHQDYSSKNSQQDAREAEEYSNLPPFERLHLGEEGYDQQRDETEAVHGEDQYPSNWQESQKFRHHKYQYVGRTLAGDDGKSHAHARRIRDSGSRRNTGSSISSGETAISSKNRNDAQFDDISPSSPDQTQNSGSCPMATTTTTASSNPIRFSNSNVQVPCTSPTLIGSSNIPGPRLPPPPYYAPRKYPGETSPKSYSPSNLDDDEHELMDSARSRGQTAATSRTQFHPSHRHSFSNVFSGGTSQTGDETVIKRSHSLSPTENQSYQLHLPEPSDDVPSGAEYARYITSSVPTSGGTMSYVDADQGDRRWNTPPPLTRRKFLAPTVLSSSSHDPTTTRPRTAYHHHPGSIIVPPQTSIQFHAHGPSRHDHHQPYFIPHTSTSTTSSSSYDSNSRPGHQSATRHHHQMDHHHPYPRYVVPSSLSSKHRAKSSSSSSNNNNTLTLSNIRMRVAGLPSSADSLGESSPRDCSSSTSGVSSNASLQQPQQSTSSSSSGNNAYRGGHARSPRDCSSSTSGVSSNASLQQPQQSTSSSSSGNNAYRGGHAPLVPTKPRTKTIRSCQVPQEFRYTAQEVDSMVERVENYPGPLVPCAVCSKFVKRERLRAHIHECHLLQGEKIICQYCGIALKSKGSYRVHIWRHKRGNLPTKKFKTPPRPGT